jgi:gamma-glutamyltranspeptidase/glutathione hydrolase
VGVGSDRRQRSVVRQFAVGALFLAAACTQSATERAQSVVSFVGGVTADEPRATLAGLAALESGGTAADAAVATFFSLTVTYPLAAGLAGGGACVAYDALTGTAESIDFLPATPALGGAVAVPGSVRGMAALHARFGRLRWPQLILYAEEKARFGFLASRALATAAREYAGTTGASSLGPFVVGGRPVEEGATIEQPALAEMLSTVRVRGGGDLYFGNSARGLVLRAQNAGGRMTVDDLKQFLPTWKRSNRTAFGDLSYFTTAEGPGGGALSAAIWAMLTDQQRYTQTPLPVRVHLIAEASTRALTERAGGGEATAFRAAALMTDFDPTKHRAAKGAAVPDLTPWIGAGRDGTTGFVTLDATGSAVSCVLTMNAPFGDGKLDEELGIFFAPAVPGGVNGWLRTGTDFMAPVVIANGVTGEFVLGLTATGGPAAPIAAVSTAAIAVLEAQPLRQAVNAARVFALPNPDTTVYERGTTLPTVEALRAAGHRVTDGSAFGIVNAILCFGGATLDPSSCQFVADGRGFGLADGGTQF